MPKKRKLPIHNFSSLASLSSALCRIEEDNKDRFINRDIVTDFVNLITESAKDPDNLDKDGEPRQITNFGTSYRTAMSTLTGLHAMVIGNPHLVDVNVRNTEFTRDEELATEIQNAFNQIVVQDNRYIQDWWEETSGFCYVEGGGPVVFEDDEALYPSFRYYMMFPSEAGRSALDIPYAFERVEWTLSDLDEIYEDCKDDDEGEGYFIKEEVERLRKLLRQNAQGQAVANRLSAEEIMTTSSSVRDDDEQPDNTIGAWIYWELDRDDDGDTHVNKIIFVDTQVSSAVSDESEFSRSEYFDYGDEDDTDTSPGTDRIQGIVYAREKEIKNADMWIETIVADSEIGRPATQDTLRGVAEVIYPAASELEELRNDKLLGAKMRAIPLLRDTGGANIDEIYDFCIEPKMMLPSGTEFAQIPQDYAEATDGVMAEMAQTVTSIGASNPIQGGGELLRQQVERDRTNSNLSTGRHERIRGSLNRIFTEMVLRALTLKPEKHSRDYNTIKRFQSAVDRSIISIFELQNEEDNEKLAKEVRKMIAEREYGGPKYISVKVNRRVSGIDRQDEIEQSEYFRELLASGMVDAATRSEITYLSVLLRSNDPDIANKFKPQYIEERRLGHAFRAKLEWDMILRAANIGQPHTTLPGDAHEVHFETHLVDLIGYVNSHGLRPWDQQSVLEFSAIIEHIAQHIAALRQQGVRGNALARMESELQNAIAQGVAIIQVLSQEQQAEGQEEDPDKALKRAKTMEILDGIRRNQDKEARDIEDHITTIEQRMSRIRQGDERQRLMELTNDFNRQIGVEKLRLDVAKQRVQGLPN